MRQETEEILKGLIPMVTGHNMYQITNLIPRQSSINTSSKQSTHKITYQNKAISHTITVQFAALQYARIHAHIPTNLDSGKCLNCA